MVNAFSFCLYGPQNPRYYPAPMTENIQLILKHFPGWVIFVYVGADVDPRYVDILKTAPRVILRYTGKIGAANMIDRFLAIDEPNVDLMMVRDADSRVHWKDRWAIKSFLKSPFLAHTIRDNPAHTTAIMGGLWGIRKEAGLVIKDEYTEFEKNPINLGSGHDQSFLAVQLYPKIKNILLVHYSNDLAGGDPHATEFPFPYTNDIYCGRVESTPFQDSEEPRSTLGFLPPSFLKISS
uniref:Glycosyltransferase n=1 Tax=viral metagenome TaxID=1070528 RepID=A0A6C0J4S6_9ZZZZ